MEKLGNEIGDRDADLYESFTRLFAAHDRRLYAYILTLVGDPHAAEDVFGETSIVLWREFAKFRQGADFAPWALAIAFNQVRKYRRLRKRDRLVFSEGLIADLAKDAAEVATQLDARERALRRCIAKLTERTQLLLEWFYGAGLPAGEIAERWGLTVHAVYKSLKTTRRTLYLCIEKELAAEES